MNQIIQIKEFHCKIDLDIKYYSNQTGYVKGIKTLKNNQTIYLVEFFNHNRIWATSREVIFKNL